MRPANKNNILTVMLIALLAFWAIPSTPGIICDAHASTQPTESPLKSMWDTFGPLLQWMGISSHDWAEWGDEQCWDEHCNQCNPQPEEDEEGGDEEDGDDPTSDGGEWI